MRMFNLLTKRSLVVAAYMASLVIIALGFSHGLDHKLLVMAVAAPVIDSYTTARLVQLVPNLKIAQMFLLNTFFPNIVESDTEEVAIDVDVGLRRLAPFCSPMVEGKFVESRRYQTNRFKPAYIKDKRAPDIRKPLRRQIGERIGGGDLSAGQREMLNIQFEMADQIDMINRRLEWMAANVLKGGTLTVTGEGFPTTVIDYGRAAALTITNSGTAKWTAANIANGTASPTGDIENWGNAMLKASGAVATKLVFTLTAWKMFLLDPAVQKSAWYAGYGQGVSVNLGSQIQRGAQPKGRWGQYEMFVYNDWYIDPTSNVETPMLTDGTVVMSGDDLMGTRAFGAILDPSFMYGPMAYAPKTWINEDPAQRLIMMQSSPLVIPSRVNACLGAQVCDAVLS